MIIPIDIRHVLLPGSKQEEFQAVMGALSKCLTSASQAFMRRHGNAATNLTRSRISDDGFAELNFDHVLKAHSDTVDDSLALQSLLTCMVEINLAFLECWDCPKLYECGARYGRTNDWRAMPAIIETQRADCKSVGPARCAELLKQGVPATCVHRWYKRDDGGTDFHILLMVDGETFEDPSKIMGMNPETVAEL
jgi:hypothetical protein